MVKVFYRSVSYDHSDEGYFSFQSIDQKAIVKNIDVVVGKSSLTSRCFPKDEAHMYGSCNGLLLIRAGIDFFLLNPSICVTEGWLSCPHLSDYDFIESGLGFDSHTKQYKILLALSKDAEAEITMVIGCFGTKSWKSLNFPYKFEDSFPGPVLKSRLHWLLYGDQSRTLVYFDLKIDEFIELPAPEPNEGNLIYCLGLLDGCLCVNRDIPEVAATEVLAMKEYGVKASWTVLFKFNHLPRYQLSDWAAPLFYMDKGKVLMHVYMEDVKEVIALYDIDNGSWKDIALIGADDPYEVPVVVYEETPYGQNATEAGCEPKLVWKVIPYYNESEDDEDDDNISFDGEWEVVTTPALVTCGEGFDL